MLWVQHALHVSYVELEECLSVEGVVLQETKIGKELYDVVLDWRPTERPCVLGLHIAPLSVRLYVDSNAEIVLF